MQYRGRQRKTAMSSCTQQMFVWEEDGYGSEESAVRRLNELGLLEELLIDKSTGSPIIWATDAYAALGDAYARTAPMTPALLLRPPFRLMTRAAKESDTRSERTKSRAEVFTPLWVVKEMNDFTEAEWFGEEGIFDAPQVRFPKGLSWQQFVLSRRLELTCGEAPYLASRYDVTSGFSVLPASRVGILDRKLRVVTEYAAGEDERLEWGFRALQATYGYEFQGDNVLLARLNMLLSFEEYMRAKLDRLPSRDEYHRLLDILAWNIWQMDGLSGLIPFSQELRPQHVRSSCRVFDWQSGRSVEYNRLKEGRKEIEFDFIIGNPPYHDETEGTSDMPLYHLLMDAAYSISDRVLLITPARFLFNAGKTPKTWNEKMLADPHLRVVQFYPLSSKVFADTDIMGGLAVTYRNTRKDYGAIGVFFSFEEMRTLAAKISPHVRRSRFSDIMFPQNHFNLRRLYADFPEFQALISSDGRERRVVSSSFEKLTVFHGERSGADDIRVLGIVDGNRRCYRYIARCYIEDNGDLDQWKVLLPRSNGSAAIGESPSTPLVGEPLVAEPAVGFTQSFMGIGAFATRAEAENCLKYVKTKFARALLGLLKITPNNPPEKWRYVPLQEFSSASDIDWAKSVAEIDRQLYAKYGLDATEIAFIESHVKGME